eukprot:2779432-Pyramimonas_sp.AAC.1
MLTASDWVRGRFVRVLAEKLEAPPEGALWAHNPEDICLDAAAGDLVGAGDAQFKFVVRRPIHRQR